MLLFSPIHVLLLAYILGYYDVVTIPVGARHIMVYEDPSTTDNFSGKLDHMMSSVHMLYDNCVLFPALAVNGDSILNGHFRIKSFITFTDNGVILTYIRSQEESVTTPGPLSQPQLRQSLVCIIIYNCRMIQSHSLL